jgi:hypothetical protein
MAPRCRKIRRRRLKRPGYEPRERRFGESQPPFFAFACLGIGRGDEPKRQVTSEPMKAAVGLLLLALSAGAWGQNPPELPFQATSTPPTIDGNLETGEWAAASQVTGFIDIVTSAAAPEQTQAWLTSDAEFIYVAFACADSQPDTITARERQRGASFQGEDLVAFLIDPFASNRYNNQFEFTVNALGTQNERLGAGRATKQEWRGDWSAATQRNEHGWTAEIRIPWRMLDYPGASPAPGSAAHGRI